MAAVTHQQQPAGEEHDTDIRPEELDPERPRPVETPWGAFALYRVGEEVLVAQSFCPHLLGPLFQGTLTGDTVTCPWHRWRFCLRTGKRLDLPLLGWSSPALARLDARVGARGTLVLSPPSDGSSPLPRGTEHGPTG